MSFSRKVLRKMKKVMGVIGAISVLTAYSSQVSFGVKIKKVRSKIKKVRSNNTTNHININPINTINEHVDPINTINEYDSEKNWSHGGCKYNFRNGVLRVSTVWSKKVSKSWNKENNINRKVLRFWNEENNINRDEITEIVVEDGINDIDEFAFENCKFVKKVTLPNSLKHIGQFAFQGCVSLEEVTAEGSVGVLSTRDENNINRDKITEVVVEDGINDNRSFAFKNCKSLKEVTLPRYIGQSAFKGVSLKRVTFEDSVGVLSTQDVRNMRRVESDYPDTVNENGDLLDVKREKRFSNLIVAFAFDGCVSLKKITVPNLIETICKHAFYGCVNLKEVVAMRDVVLDELAFSGTPFQYLKDFKGEILRGGCCYSTIIEENPFHNNNNIANYVYNG